MAPEPNFESMSFNPFSNNNNFSDGNQDPDVNFFLGNIPSLNTEYFSPSDIKIGFSKFKSSDSFSVLHLNTRSLGKNFKISRSFIQYDTIYRLPNGGDVET